MLSTVGLVIDVLIVLAIVILGILGYKKGLLKSLLSVFGWSFCLVVAIWSAKYVAGWIDTIFNFSSKIGGGIANSLFAQQEFFKAPINTYADKTALMGAFDAVSGNINPVIRQLVKVIFSNQAIDFTSSEAIGSVVGSIGGQIILVVISAIFTFAVLMIAMFLINKLIDKITTNRIIGGLNKIMGLVLGVAKGAVIVFAVNILLVLLSTVPFVGSAVTPFVNNNTYVEKFVYEKTDYVVDKYIINGELLQEFIQKTIK